MSHPTLTPAGPAVTTKQCVCCLELKPIADFRRRSGKRAGTNARRGICRDCRNAGTEDGAPKMSRRAEPAPRAGAVSQPDRDRDEALLTTDFDASFSSRSPDSASAAAAAPKRTRKRRRKKPAAKAQKLQTAATPLSEEPPALSPIGDAAGEVTAPKRKRSRRRRGKGTAARELTPGASLPAPSEPAAPAEATASAPAQAQRTVPAPRSVTAMRPFRMSPPPAPEAEPVALREMPPSRPRQPAVRSGPQAARNNESRTSRPEVRMSRGSSSAASRNPVSPPSSDRAVARQIDPHDYRGLKPTRQGFVRMRGRTDKGRGWYQEIELDMAVTLVREHAAVVVNRHTIRRLLSNRDFRLMILNRDKYTCYFCGEYGDTIDHMLPRSKGGHTTPDNCVCACNLCNQTKANRDLDEFIASGIPEKPDEA